MNQTNQSKTKQSNTFTSSIRTEDPFPFPVQPQSLPDDQSLFNDDFEIPQTMATVPPVQSGKVDWAKFSPKDTPFADTLDASRVREIWAKIYKGANVRDEDGQKMVRYAIYVYAAKNGTSRAGAYEGFTTLANGEPFDVAIFARAAKGNIRKFMRANQDEAYEYFKGSRKMEEEERYLAKCEAFTTDPTLAFACADFLEHCRFFTPAEKAVHQRAKDGGIERARRARNGHTLEEVEDKEHKRGIEVQGNFDPVPEIKANGGW